MIRTTIQGPFWRVENEEGVGMYRLPDCYMAEVMPAWDERHPMPYDDAVLAPYWVDLSSDERARHLFAFTSPAQLKFWVYKPEVRGLLDRAGARVSVYEASGVYGDTQAVFLKDTAELIETISLLEI